MAIGFNTVIKAIGTFIVLMGLIYLIKPMLFRTVIAFFSRGSRLYLAALLRFALAIVFFWGARKCDMKWVIIAFGLIFLLSGILIFMLGLNKAKAILSWYLEQPVFMLRIIAIVALGVGLIIVYAA